MATPSSLDTSPAAQAFLIEGFRRMSPQRKLERVREMTRAAQQMALARLRVQYPDATDRELSLRLASLWLPRELMIRAFGWDPVQRGR